MQNKAKNTSLVSGALFKKKCNVSGLPLSFKIWKSETAIKEGKAWNFGSHKEK